MDKTGQKDVIALPASVPALASRQATVYRRLRELQPIAAAVKAKTVDPNDVTVWRKYKEYWNLVQKWQGGLA